MTLVIMAAGMGSRFGGLKQIEPIDEYGNFIIDYSIYDAILEGFDKVVFIIRHENYEIFRDTIGKRIEDKIEVKYVFQEFDNLKEKYPILKDRVKPLGTAHAILCCKDIVKENFAIINSDDFYGRNAYHVIANFLKNNKNPNEYAMVGYLAKNTLTDNGAVKRGVCSVENGHLIKLIESKIEKSDDKITATPLDGGDKFNISFDDLVSMNIFGFTPNIFPYLEKSFQNFLTENANNLLDSEFLIPNVVFEQINNKMVEVSVLTTDAIWQGVTYREDKEKVVSELKKLVDNNIYPQGLWNNY